MNPDLVVVALSVASGVTYAGFVLLAGTFCFWGLVWPEGRRDHTLVVLVVIGMVGMVLGTLAVPVVRLVLGGELPADVVHGLGGAVLMVRLAALAGTGFFLVDLVRGPVGGWRRVLILVLLGVLAATMVARSDAGTEPRDGLEILATAGLVLAAAGWLGGLLALAAYVIPRNDVAELDRLVRRSARVAAVGVVVLLATGAIRMVAVAGAPRTLTGSRWGLVIVITAAVVVLLLVLANQGRRYAAREAFRRVHLPVGAQRDAATTGPSLAAVLSAELAIAFVIVSTTTLLVVLAPH